MKKRMKLTEKELAIGMWLYIKSYIAQHKDALIVLIKTRYLKEHHMLGKWKNLCILCSKHNDVCPRCPLDSCSSNYKTLWSVVSNSIHKSFTRTLYEHPFTLEERLEACDKIIEAIEKDIPDDYVGQHIEFTEKDVPDDYAS